MSCTTYNEAHKQRRGDLDSDGQITVVDEIITLWMAVRGEYDGAADMNRDGMVTDWMR